MLLPFLTNRPLTYKNQFYFQMYDHSKPPPQLIIDGRNAWFYDDLESLVSIAVVAKCFTCKWQVVQPLGKVKAHLPLCIGQALTKR